MASRTHRFAAVTAGLTFLLILVGEFTAVSGSGATCQFQWPSCSGQFLPFGLPIHDFIEWFHRAFAGTIGLLIIGTAIALWRRYDDRMLRTIGLVAVILLPVQIFVGGVTVTLGGIFPGGYQPITQTIHHLAALGIYGALVLGALWSRRADSGIPPSRHDVARAARFSLLSLPFVFLLSRGTLLNYITEIHIIHHGFELLLFTGVIITLDRARSTANTTATTASWLSLATTLCLIIIGVGLFQYVTAVKYTYYALIAITAVLLAYVARSTTTTRASDAPVTDSA